MAEATQRPSPERASALFLFPALALVVVVLGALAVDVALVHLAERQAFAAAAAAANDAATYGLDPAALRAGEEPRLDPARARRAAEQALAGGQPIGRADPPQVEVVGTTVTVTVSLEVDRVFARGVPRAPRSTTVDATATADAVQR